MARMFDFSSPSSHIFPHCRKFHFLHTHTFYTVVNAKFGRVRGKNFVKYL